MKQGLLCGAEGLPHLIADGRASHAGEFVLVFYFCISQDILAGQVEVTNNIQRPRINLLSK